MVGWWIMGQIETYKNKGHIIYFTAKLKNRNSIKKYKIFEYSNKNLVQT